MNNMYKQTSRVKIKGVPKGEPVDLYIMKRGADLIAAAVTSTTYQTARITVENGIREVEDFTRLCDEHNFILIKDTTQPKTYNLEFDFDMRDTLCTVDDYPCGLASLPEQLISCISG
jgi:hypothetical protein